MPDADRPDPELPYSAAAERNRDPILAALSALLPAEAAVLEIASGTGQHAAHFAAAQPGWRWQPSEADAVLRRAIAARCAGLANVRPPLALDVLTGPWPTADERAASAAATGPVDAVYCANLIHIAPWAVCPALMQGAARLLAPGGWLLLYGPYLIDGEPTAPSNLAFDADLRARDPRWGLRRLADVQREARQVGLAFEQALPMPANNRLVVWRRPGASGPTPSTASSS